MGWTLIEKLCGPLVSVGKIVLFRRPMCPTREWRDRAMDIGLPRTGVRTTGFRNPREKVPVYMYDGRGETGL